MIDCVIFDLDGTLIDSETLCNQAFLDLIPEIDIPLHELVAQFRGRKLAWIFDYIEKHFNCILPSNMEQIYREHVKELFESNLCAFPGVSEALENISLPICIATSAPMSKAVHALTKTNLLHFFGDKIFSSYEIGIWKPEPGIFLYAADRMNISPKTCLVIEDSDAGIKAAKAAGMRVVQFCSCSSQPTHDEFFRSYYELSAVYLLKASSNIL